MTNQAWFSSYDKGVPPSLAPYPEAPLFHFLEQAAAKFPDHPCTIFKGATLTYRQVNELSDRAAAALASLGVKRGDRVVLFMPNTPQFVICFYGVLKAGGVVVATNPLYSAREIEHQVNDSGAEVAIVMSMFYSRLKEVQPKTCLKKIILTNIKEYLSPVTRVLFTLLREKKGGHQATPTGGDGWLQPLLARFAPGDRPKMAIGPNDLALFQYSGGTTGLAKAAVVPHSNLIANSLQIHAWLGSPPDGQHVTLMAIPLFHVYGLVVCAFSIRMVAKIVLVPNPRDLADVFDNINKHHPTIFPGVPTLYNAINNHPDVAAGKVQLGSIWACFSGSAPLLLETKTRFEKLTGGKLIEAYGLSEAPTVTHCNPFQGQNKEGSIGLPLPDVECRVISLDDGVTEVPPGDIGELILRGPQVMKSYWNMPEETAITLHPADDGGKPWLFTGDIVRMDEQGYFFIVDRKKELIKAGGFQVWPREIEEVIAAHPKVLEVGAAGVPDAHRGETAKAWIVVRPGETLTEAEVRDWCQTRLAKFKIPTIIEFRTELPKTTVGKVLRRELVRQHKEKTPA